MIGILAIVVACTFAGCQYPVEKTIGDFLKERDENHPLIMFDVSCIDKEEVPNYIYIFQGGNCRCYDNRGRGKDFSISLSLSELSSMNDVEIAGLYQAEWTSGFNNAMGIWLFDSIWVERIKNKEATVYYNDFMPFEIVTKTDSSGNSVVEEWLMLPHHGYGKKEYTLWYDGWAYTDAYDKTNQYSFYSDEKDFKKAYFNLGKGKDLFEIANVYKITDMHLSGVIGDTSYNGLNAGDRKLIFKDGTALSFDDKDTYPTDIKEDDYKSYVKKIHQSYKSNYHDWYYLQEYKLK